MRMQCAFNSIAMRFQFDCDAFAVRLQCDYDAIAVRFNSIAIRLFSVGDAVAM
jgi:hypothetical protein